MGTNAITTQLSNCEGSSNAGTACVGVTVLNNGDGLLYPNFPSDASNFVAWTVNSRNFLTLIPSPKPSIINSIEIAFYNNPRQGFGWPNFQLHGLANDVTVFPRSGDPQLVFDIFNNSLLSQDDQKVHIVVLRIRSPGSFKGYAIQWNFGNLINVTWLVMSEVVLCRDQFGNQTTSISFSNPAADNTVITPQSELLSDDSLTLTCSVSNEGHFLWRWRKKNTTLINSVNGTKILYGDATRTSVITVPVPSIDSFYYCDISFTSALDYTTRSFEVIAQSSKFKAPVDFVF